MSNRGKFIVFEGVEGVGKTTQLKLFKQYLQQIGCENNCVFLREPGNTTISEQIRGILLDKSNSQMSEQCEALLYAASRAQLVDEVILKALNEGKNVICDRYYHSSIAYQGYGRQLGEEYIRTINGYAIKNCRPDMVIFLDLPPEKGFARKGGADKNDRMESSSMEFFNRVYDGFVKMAEQESDIFVRIDCSGERHQTQALIIAAVEKCGLNK